MSYPYVPDGPHYKKWAFSRATADFDCPKCGEKAGFFCVRPSGRKAWPPHTERCAQINDHPSVPAPTFKAEREN